jgi:hypothetical protein
VAKVGINGRIVEEDVLVAIAKEIADPIVEGTGQDLGRRRAGIHKLARLIGTGCVTDSIPDGQEVTN